MKKYRHFALLFGLISLLSSLNATAQLSFTDLKVDNATTLNVYPTNTTRRANFSVKVTKGAFVTPNLRIKIFNDREDAQVDLSATLAQASYSAVVNGEQTANVTGTFDIATATTGGGVYTKLKAVDGTSTSVVSNNTVTIKHIGSSSLSTAIALENFTVNDLTTLDINQQEKTVTYRVRLTKDPGYTDEFRVFVFGATATTGSSIIAGSEIQTTSSGWTWSIQDPTKRVFQVQKTFQISTNSIGANDTRLVVQAATQNSFSLGRGANSVNLNRTANPIPCSSEVFVQNVSALSGTKNSGSNLYAGRAVNPSSANGDVVVRAGATAAFLARGEIILADGFSVEEGATFSASEDVSACSSLQGEVPTEVQTEGPRFAESRTIESAADGGLAIYPNPVVDEMVVTLPQSYSSRVLHIYDSQGKEVQQLTFTASQKKINVRNLQPGIYYLHTQTKDGIAKTRFRVDR